MAAGGKGHTQRPTDPDKYSDGYDRIWGKPKKVEPFKPGDAFEFHPDPRKDAEPDPKDD